MEGEKRKNEEATSRPPQLPRRLRPSAVASKCTRHSISDCGSRISDWIADCDPQSEIRNPKCLAGDVAATGAHPVRAVAHFHPDRMPATVLASERPVTEIVLAAQFIGDTGRGRVEIVRVANDLGSSTAVVGHVAQRDDVDAFVVRLPPAGPSSAARRLLGPAWRRPASASGKWKWHR